MQAAAALHLPQEASEASQDIRWMNAATAWLVVVGEISPGAMIAANSSLAQPYHHLFHGTLPWTPIAKLNTWHLWINDALMAVFFSLVDMVIRFGVGQIVG